MSIDLEHGAHFLCFAVILPPGLWFDTTRVVGIMVSKVHVSEINNTNNYNNKIPEYARDYKKEWLFIRGINKTAGRIITKIENITDYEKLFSSPGVKELVREFRMVLAFERMGKLQNISELKFKLSDVDKIIYLRIYLYANMGLRFPLIYNFDEDFQYLFENLIIFTNMTNIKNEEDFEDDLYSNFDNLESESESDLERRINESDDSD